MKNRICLLLCLLACAAAWFCMPARSLQAAALPPLPLHIEPSNSPPPDQAAVHIVCTNDTLYNIAARYHANVIGLAQRNGLTNPGLIYVGQRLIVPADAPIITPTATPVPIGNAPVVHVVQPGETLFRIALQYNTTVWSIVSANQLENSSLIYAGQRLIIPTGEAALQGAPPGDNGLPSPFVSVEVTPLPIIQGRVLAISVRTIKPVTLQSSFLEWIVPFASDGEVYHALIGINAMQKVGAYPLVITATDEQGRQVAVSMDVSIVAGKFGSEWINLPPEKQALLDPDLVKAEREKLWSVFSVFRQERYWDGLFGLPVQAKISSVFGTRRGYSGGPFNSYHEGLDFSAGGGTPVSAPAAGVVVLAEALTVRGNAVILDHGWGVHTGFYHLSEIGVTVGQSVQAGQVVGRVGSTGLSTGAHLHWDMRVRGVNVDPLEWTQRVFP